MTLTFAPGTPERRVIDAAAERIRVEYAPPPPPRRFAASVQPVSDDAVKQLRLAFKSSKHGSVVEDFTGPVPGMLYTSVRAISARINQNWDAWPSEELQKSYLTFLGKPVFVNHNNFDPNLARGRVVAARYLSRGKDKYIEVIQEIDAQRFPKLAHEIRTGGLDSVSMGVEAGFTICSYCENKATDIWDMCDHVKFHKGSHLPDPATGEPKLVFEHCYKLGFFELSYVFDPADETAVVSRVIAAGKTAAPADVADLPDYLRENPNFMKWLGEHPNFLQWLGEHQNIQPGRVTETPGRDTGGTIARMANYYLADKLHHTDWHALGAQSFLEGGPPEAHRHHEVSRATRHLDPRSPEARHVHEEYERGYQSASQSKYQQDRANTPAPDEQMGLGGYPGGHQYHPKKNRAAAVYEHKPNLRPHLLGPDAHFDFEERMGQRGFREKKAWGETTAPEDIDTLREDDDDSADDYEFVTPYHSQDDEEDPQEDEEDSPFHGGFESPAELQTPDFDQAKRLDRAQEDEGLDTDRRVEDVEEVGMPDQQQQQDPAAKRPMARRSRRSTMARTQYAAEEDEDRRPPWLRDRDEDSGDDEGSGERDDDRDDDDEDERDEERDDRDDDREEREDRDSEDDKDGDDKPPWLQEKESARRPVNSRSSRQKGRKGQRKGNPMSPQTLAERGRVASNRRRQHFADDSGHTDGGPYGNNEDLGNQGPEWITEDLDDSDPVPSAEAVDVPTGDESKASNSEGQLVARIQSGTKRLKQDLATYQRIQSRRRHADGVAEPTSVNPALSGTDDQSLKGQDFTDIGLSSEETQPDDGSSSNKIQGTRDDESRQWFAAFEQWHQQVTGRPWSQHTSAALVRGASRWAKGAGIPLNKLFPTLDIALRQARKGEAKRKATMNRTAEDQALETAAPDGRVDVEKPVRDETDERAQASQFDLGEYGHNAGDTLADPEMSSDSQIWAPGEKSGSMRTAEGMAATRCAMAYIKCGMAREDALWKLAGWLQTIRADIVEDRTKLLEAVYQVNNHRFNPPRKVAAGSRGARSIPPGLASGRVAASQRIAADDPINDSALWL